MKSNSSVRTPAIAHSNVRKSDDATVVPVGTVLRRAQRDLFFRRCLYAMFIILLVTAIAYFAIMGYIDILLDKFYSLLG